MVSINNIEYNKIVFTKPKGNSKSPSKFVKVTYGGGPVALALKLPVMPLAFGFQKNTYYDKLQYNFDLSFKGNERVHQSIKNLEDYVVEYVKNDFYPDNTLEEVREMFTSCIKPSNNPLYAPSLKVKITTKKNGQVDCTFLEPEKNENNVLPEIPFEDRGGDEYLAKILQKDTEVEPAIECIGLWFMNGKFGLSFKATVVRVLGKKEQPKVVKKYDFIDSDDSTSNSEIDFLGE